MLLKNLFYIALAFGGIYLLVCSHQSVIKAHRNRATTIWYSPLKFIPRCVGWFDVRHRVATYGETGDEPFRAWWDGAQWRMAPDGVILVSQQFWFRGLIERA